MNCFTAVMTVSLLEKWCPCSLSFIGPNRSKSEGTKSGLYGRCGKTVHPRLAMSITVTKLVWSLALLYCKGKAVFFSGLTLEIRSLSYSVSWSRSQAWWFGHVLGNPEGSPLSYPKSQCTSLAIKGCILNLFFHGKFSFWHSMECCFDSSSQWWHHISSSVTMQSRKLSLSALYWFSRPWKTWIQCSFCSCVIFQCWNHCFQYTEAGIQLGTQLCGHKPLICADDLIKTLFIWWWDSCSLPSGTWLCLSCCCCHCLNTPPTTSLCSHPLFDIHKHLVSVNVLMFALCWSSKKQGNNIP